MTLASVGKLTRKHLTVTLVKVRWKEEVVLQKKPPSHSGHRHNTWQATSALAAVLTEQLSTGEQYQRAEQTASPSIAHTPGWELPALA